jgi:hypothetical protein
MERNLALQVPVEEAGDLGEGFLGFRRERLQELGMALRFEDLKHRLDTRLPQFAVHAHRIAEQQVAGWLIPRSLRRLRIRVPTCTSTG